MGKQLKIHTMFSASVAACLSLLCATARAAPPIPANSKANDNSLDILEKKAQDALNGGDAAGAAEYATELLDRNKIVDDWRYGKIIYDGNQILGLAALQLGDVDGAKADLLAAGKTPGNGVLDTFGPDMALAKALYAAGEHAVVVQFLGETMTFWGTPPARFKNSKSFQEMSGINAAKIRGWQHQIALGQTPSLNRFDLPPPPPLLTDGSLAPNFTVRTKAGKRLRLSDYAGKTVVLDFWATWCGPCQRSLPHTNDVGLQFAGKNVVVLAINVWDSQKAFDAWLPRHTGFNGVTFALDPTTNNVTKSFHVGGIPTLYVIDPKGKISKSFVGYDGPTDDLANAIKAAR